MHRFFVEGVHHAGGDVPLAPDDARKALTVLRLTSGARVEVIDSAGVRFDAVLTADGGNVTARLDSVLAAPPRSALTIDLAQAVPKGAKMDFVIEKATELGVRSILPFRSQRVIGERTGERKRERWERIAREASRQSGRIDVPSVEEILRWDEIVARIPRYDAALVAWELADPLPMRELARVLGEVRTLLVAIGPEGGFASEEVDAASRAGARAISLGSRILRTETAGLVAVTALSVTYGVL